MSDHLSEQQRGWSPGQAVAPCLTCQAGLCGEHGARVETTTGAACLLCHGTGVVWMGGVMDRSAWTAPVPCAACRPPAPAAPRKGSRAWAIQEACRIVGIAFHGIAEYDEASDCFCSESPHQDYRNGGRALAFVEAAVREKLAREKAPAPEPGGEMSREDFAKHGSAMLLLVLQDARPRYDEFAVHFNAVAACDAALRTRAREAEERAERNIAEGNERADKLIAMHSAVVRRAERAESERDEAREQRGHASVEVGRLGLEVARLRSDLAAANARAEEAERCVGAINIAEVRRLTEGGLLAEVESLRSRLAAAEAEVTRLNDEIDKRATEAVVSWKALDDERREHAATEKARERTNSQWADGHRENARLRAAVERLVEAGAVLRNLARRFRSTVYGPEEIDRAIDAFEAAKAALDAPAAVAAAREAGGKP